jgi:hypothetical protein
MKKPEVKNLVSDSLYWRKEYGMSREELEEVHSRLRRAKHKRPVKQNG